MNPDQDDYELESMKDMDVNEDDDGNFSIHLIPYDFLCFYIMQKTNNEIFMLLYR